MRVLFSVFLTIFLSGCFDNFPGSDDLQRPDIRGTSVGLTDHCQTLTVIEPEEVRKHELPFELKGYRDECLVLVEAPNVQFSDTGRIYYTCTLFWDADDSAANAQMESDIDILAGFGLSGQIIADGDLDFIETNSGDVFRKLIFFMDDNSTPQYVFTQDDLWPLLTDKVDNLKDLEWRFDLQYNNPGLCAEGARWGIVADQIYIDDVKKCYGGTDSRLDNYIFFENGIIDNIESLESNEDYCSTN